MAKTPHTPGPWEAEGRTIYQVDQYGIAYCEGKRAEIDAKLMAASPEMKDVLVNILYEGSESVSMPEWLWEDLDSALRKAGVVGPGGKLI